MSVDLFADLIDQFRAGLEESTGKRLDPLNPPATEEALGQAEDLVGVVFPEDLKNLFRVADGLYVLSAFMGGLGPNAELIVMFNEVLDLAIDDIKASGYDHEASGHWFGVEPQSDYIVFGKHNTMALGVEVGGPLDGRVFVFDGPMPGSPSCWATIGASIEGVLRWSLELAQNTYTGIYPFAVGTAPPKNPDARTVVQFNAPNVGTPEFEPFIKQIRPAIARHGGTPAAFGGYDVPPGYGYPNIF